MSSYNQSQYTQQNIRAIQANGHKIQPAKTMRAWKVPATSEFPPEATGGRQQTHMWLEEGNNDRSGMQHMETEKKVRAFAGVGIPREQLREKLPPLAEAHTTAGRFIGHQGQNKTRPVMSTFIDGKVCREAVTVADNGFIVSMNPTSSKVKKFDGPGPVSDRTMENLYYYPPNSPSRRGTTDVAAKSPRTVESVPRARTYR